MDTTKTYAEQQGEEPFNWNHFLAQDTRTEEEWIIATRLAGQWVTCACGNQCASLPRNEIGCPMDEELDDLGMLFYDAIVNWDREEAIDILGRIEARSAHLLSQL